MMTGRFTDKPVRLQLIIALTTALLFIPFLGGVHLFDWDEINFAESAREMITTGDYLTVRINYEPFWEKPPLFIWMQVLSMKAFGINEFAARFPNALCGICTLLILFNIGRKLYDSRFGLIWVVCYAGSWLPFFYFKSGIIDPWFNLFIFMGIHFFIDYVIKLKGIFTPNQLIFPLVLSAVSLGFGVLTKGPVAVLVFGLAFSVFFLAIRGRMRIIAVHVFLFLLVLGFVGGFWFLLQIMSGHGGVVLDFIRYQIKLFTTKDAGHGGFLLYHFVVLLIGVFPSSLLALPILFGKIAGNERQILYQRWMKILFWVVLILFTIVKTKIVHYSSLCYFPIAFMAAIYADALLQRAQRINRLVLFLLVFTGVIVAIAVACIPFIDLFKQKIIATGWIRDEFAIGNLQANGRWTGWESITGLILLAGLLVFAFSRHVKQTVLYLYGTSLVFIFMSVLLYTPKIERYSQRAAIDFYKSMAGKKVYINTLGFKSYAHYFYFRKPKPDKPEPKNPESLLSGKIDRDAYFVTKVNEKGRFLSQYPDLKLLYEKNGFVFLMRAKND